MNQLLVDDVPPSSLYDSYRVTVGGVLITNKQGIILVQPSKGSGTELILPQGGIKPGETFRKALNREVQEELPGTTLKQTMMVPLGHHVNKLPPERGKLDKYIFWFAAFIDASPQKVDQTENTSFCVVCRPDELQYAISGARPEKRQMILTVVEEARKIGMLTWQQSVLQAA